VTYQQGYQQLINRLSTGVVDNSLFWKWKVGKFRSFPPEPSLSWIP